MRKTKDFLTAINNGWLLAPRKDIDKVFDIIDTMILEKKVISEYIDVNNGPEIKKYIEDVTYSNIEIEVLGNTIVTPIKIHINLDYDLLSESEYYTLKETIRKSK